MSQETRPLACPHCGMPLPTGQPQPDSAQHASSLPDPGSMVFEFVPVVDLPGSTHSEDQPLPSLAAQPRPAPAPADGPHRPTAPPSPRNPFRWLLPSYASALTLALFWMLATGRVTLRPTPRPATPPPEIPSLGSAPLPAILPSHVVALGSTLRLADLEVLPSELRLAPVRLVNQLDPGQQRDGGPDALWLRLRLRNLSETTPLTPIDPEFIRHPDQGYPDSLIQTDRAPLLVFPLAVSSEWTIDGQHFPQLQPGEEADVWLVSEPQARHRLSPRMLWRLRVRSTTNRTALIGIEFSSADVPVGEGSSP
ncbi:MAG: hypothetical protein KatS3mg108_3288 [Isosphaeraceae bacterium]|nr:MAG: hypothetical protein KatS3mg108_3288 [Isosphaeraceae bacterium]